MPSHPCVLLTRAPEDNAPLAKLLRDLEVPVRETPCVETRWLTPAAPAAQPAAIAFASRRAVEGFWRAGLHPTFLHTGRRPLVTAVGERTARALQDRGVEPDLIASPATGADLARVLDDRLAAQEDVLIPCGKGAPGELESHLRQRARACHALHVYENLAPELPELHPDAVAVAFVAAPSAAARLLDRFPWMATRPLLPIGPTTAAALESLGAQRILNPEAHLEDQARALAAAWHDARTSDPPVTCGDPASGVREPAP